MKKLSLWIKYGLVAFLAATLIILFPFLMLKLSPLFLTSFMNGLFGIIFYFLIQLIFVLPLQLFDGIISTSLINNQEYVLPTISGSVIAVILWFLVGALIGYITERRRNNEKQ